MTNQFSSVKAKKQETAQKKKKKGDDALASELNK